MKAKILKVFRCFKCSKKFIVENPIRSRARRCPICHGELIPDRKLEIIPRKPTLSSNFRYFIHPVGEEANRVIGLLLSEMQLGSQSLTVVTDQRGQPVNLWEVPVSVLEDFLADRHKHPEFRMFRCKKSENVKTGLRKI